MGSGTLIKHMMGAGAVALAFFVCGVGGLPRASHAEICRSDQISLRGAFGQARFHVEIADDPGEQAQGLMHVPKMPTSHGMLFVYDAPMQLAFWMKNTLIPLDIIFADQRGVVTTIHENAVPGDLTPLPSQGAAQYVLEINGGMARRLGITQGAQMRHPAISAAQWRCE
ncbi:MAG: DUF192 domain-containing protein [Pelagimonas sp.]|jgi:uncharacterized membrane protein (UPF0127 family)|nr:DUF192 domain-containing protein [Pelagimonas sp.]